ncbi:PIN domain-containing protein [Algoriphagus halophytocola]|uniref:PIN domain-containing protein n=1 Tax=Algoriphagus halophytocola TaxID=2991499 RepID=A0ABY6MF08_9BACT|nr:MULTISPECIES: PIN domain-containing protein [unclassified Algoriphagus]UZD22395.1 PIN domain-containing protein [Algoriphagus sp. TR-M5]WBL43654.1 PIN domain-containing protein [Algoriphagus sp. TR-M9]
MRRIFLDTNVILDLLGERVPFYDAIAKVLTLADQKKITLVVSPLSFTTIEYVLGKYLSKDLVLKKLRMFKILCEVCAVDEEIIEKGLNSSFGDFEDAVQYFAALQSNCSIIITRNGKDFRSSNLSVMTAEEYLSSIS